MWKPAAEAHAIERVGLSFFWTDTLPLKFIGASLSHADQMIGDYFDDKQEMRVASLSLKLDPQAESNDFVQKNEPSGFSYFYDRASQDEGARFTPDMCLFSSSSYGTWAGFREEAEKVLEPFLVSVLKATNVKTIKLEYSDRFVFDGERHDADVREIVDLPAVHLDDDAIGKGYPWHSRRGWFLTTNNGADLINLDVSEAIVTHRDRPEEQLVSVHVSTVVERRLKTPLADKGVLKKIVDELHVQSKVVTKSVLTDNAIAMIGIK